MRVVRRFGIPVDPGQLAADVQVAVVYEQWGWPLTDAAWNELGERFTGLLLVDRVDSADFFAREYAHELPNAQTVEVLSLSKLLGLEGGGLARGNGRPIVFEPRPQSEAMRGLMSRVPAQLVSEGYRELFKESQHAVHPAALAWLQQNCLTGAAEAERSVRQRHAKALLDTPLSHGWPAWMIEALQRGAGPAWAPVLRGQDPWQRWSVMRALAQSYGVVSTSRPFNWSGNPLRPADEMCLALPVHGGFAQFEEVVAALAHI
jgi:hypothetical protein